MSTNLMDLNAQWSTRPNDERFLTLEELEKSVLQRRRESWTVEGTPSALKILPLENNGIGVEVYDRTKREARVLIPTNYAFGNLAQYAQAPGSFLRTQPAELASIVLQWNLENRAVRENVLTLAQSNGDNKLRAMTSTSYGRIWDSQVVEAVKKVNHDGKWTIPSASYQARDPRRATTLYASDRDVFIFLCNESTQLDIGNGRTLNRGFFTWNSEVGHSVFGLTTFFYDHICDNRIIWGATGVEELRIRHTGGAPERFGYEGAQYLKRYAEETAQPVIEQIHKAQSFELPRAERDPKDKTEGWGAWLKKRGFTDALAKNTVASAQAEEGQARSLWDIVNGVTAHARSIPHTDERVKVEALAGKLMAEVK